MALVRGCERAHVNSAPLSRNNGDDCVCVAALAVFVCARLIYIHAITPRSFFFFFFLHGQKSDSTPFIGNGHSPSPNSVESRPVFYFLFIIGHWSM